jgi:membrane protease YdiL (CAAX protease family)
VLVAVYLASVVTAEATTVFVSVTAGVTLHALIILAATGWHLVRESNIPLPILGIPSLLRILSFTMPVPDMPVGAWYVLVGVPVLAGCFLAIWAAHWNWRTPGLRPRLGRGDLLAVVMGIPFGWVAASAPGGARLPFDSAADPWMVAVVLLVFVALPEELLFRGMIQRIFVTQFGAVGVLLGAVLFAAMYLPSLSAEVVAVMALASLVFGWTVASTGNLGGAVLGHAVLLLTAWLLPRLGIV